MSLTRMKRDETRFYPVPKQFCPIGTLNQEEIKKIFEFSYDITFGGKGGHRESRSGGELHRKNGQIFVNAFQGKVAEFGLYNYFSNKYDIKEPDLDVWGRGKWDSFDLEINKNHINVKSTKFFGNLLLLETKDWNNKGQYIPNINEVNKVCNYEYFIFCRVKSNLEKDMKVNRLYFADTADKDKLFNIVNSQKWEYDAPGYVTNSDLIDAINNRFIILKGELISNTVSMDAENYYIQSIDMRPIKNLFALL